MCPGEGAAGRPRGDGEEGRAYKYTRDVRLPIAGGMVPLRSLSFRYLR